MLFFRFVSQYVRTVYTNTALLIVLIVRNRSTYTRAVMYPEMQTVSTAANITVLRCEYHITLLSWIVMEKRTVRCIVRSMQSLLSRIALWTEIQWAFRDTYDNWMLLKFPFRASRGIEQHLSNLAIESKIVEIKNTQTLTLGRNTNYSTAGSQQLGVICSLEKRTATEPTRGACLAVVNNRLRGSSRRESGKRLSTIYHYDGVG